jgi:hypothetical protein
MTPIYKKVNTHETKYTPILSVAGICSMKTYHSKKIISSTLYCSSIGFITMQYLNFAMCFGYRRIGSCHYNHQPRASSSSITSTFAKLWLSTSPLRREKEEDCESKHHGGRKNESYTGVSLLDWPRQLIEGNLKPFINLWERMVLLWLYLDYPIELNYLLF